MAHPYWRLDLHVTEACNLACPYCYAHEREGQHLPPAEALRALDWLFETSSDKVHVTFWGGEPLLRLDELERIADAARQRARRTGKRLTLSMPTNATLLGARALDWIERQQVRIFLSIDGDAVTQAGRPTRGGGSSHEQAAKGLRRALAHGLRRPPAVRMTVTPESAGRVADNVAYFVDAGVSELLIYPAIDLPWSDEARARFARGQRALARLLVTRLEAAPADGAAGVVRLRSWLAPLRTLFRRAIADPTLKPRARGGPLGHCGVGTELVALSVDGSLTPCHRFAFYSRGRRDDEAQGWETLGDLGAGVDDERAAPFAALRTNQLGREGGPRCVDCELFDLCTFRCLAINYAATGELLTVPPQACALVSAQIEACREVVSTLGSDPRLPLYLGLPVGSALRAAAREIGRRALDLYQRRDLDLCRRDE